MKPQKIKVEKGFLHLTWENGSEEKLMLKYLRDECPCAGCKGETILLKSYRPAQLPVFHPDLYKIRSIKTVGEYAIQISWKDGHETGIYSWEYLKTLLKDQNNGTKQNYTKLI